MHIYTVIYNAKLSSDIDVGVQWDVFATEMIFERRFIRLDFEHCFRLGVKT